MTSQEEEVIFDDLNPPEAVITSGRACNVRYRLSDNYVATSGDWVGLFRCTKDACELVGFEWAATEDPSKDTGHRRRMLYFHADQIKRPLRATDDDFYHFAYVTRVGRIAGQSGHFRVRQGEDTTRPSAPPSLGPADVCYATRQCLANCRMLPVNDGRNAQALEKFQGVIEQLEMRKVNEGCQTAWQNGCDDQIPGKVVVSQNRLRTSSLKSDLKSSCFRLETSPNRCHGCQMALRELRSLKHRLEMELNAGRITLEEMEEDIEAQRQERAGRQQQLMAINSKETACAKEEELLDAIEDLKMALEWSKERERCLQHQLNLERTLRMELIRSREDIESSRTVNGRNSLNKQQDSSHRFQVDITDAFSSHTVTKDTKSTSSDSLESPISRYVTEKDIRGRRVLVCADCLQRKEQQKPQKQQQQHPSISIDRPRRPKKPDETDTESGKAPAKRPVLVADRDTHSKEGHLAPEVLLRQAVDLGEQVVPVAFQEMERTSKIQVCDAARAQMLSEVLREESVQKFPDLQPIRESLGEILALQAAVETSLSEINNKEAVVPDVPKKLDAKGTGLAVSAVKEATISPAVVTSLDAEKKLTYPEVVSSTKEGRPIVVSSVHPERKSGESQKSSKPQCAAKPVFQNPTDDQLTRANSSRKSDRQQTPATTTVIVKSRDSLTTYSGSNLSLWLLLGNDSEPDRIVAKQTRKGSHKSQRPPRGYDLITETKYRGSSSSNAPTDTERTSSGTNEVVKRRIEEDECLAAGVSAAGSNRAPSFSAKDDTLKGISCNADISSAEEKTPSVRGSFVHPGSPVVITINTPHQSSTVQQSAHPNTSSINSRQLALDAAVQLLSSYETLTDSSSSPIQADTYQASQSTDNSYYRILPSPNDYGVDDSLPIILAVPPPSTVEPISSAFSAVAKEHSAPNFNRSSRFDVVVPSVCAAQQSTKPDATCFNRATHAEANQGTDAAGSVDGGTSHRCTQSAGRVTSRESGIKLNLYSGTLKSSPSSGTNNDSELIRRISEMGTGNNAVLLEPEERKEECPKSPDPVFTSSSGFCFISDETIRCLSGILENAMHLTAALKLLDACSPLQTARPSEVTITDTAKSAVYNEESSSSSPPIVDHNSRQIKIIKPMPVGKAMGGGRLPDAVACGAKVCKGMNSRQSGMAVQNARIISDSIREYHRKMKASVEVPEENPKALKAEEQYRFPDPPKGNVEPNVTTESGADNPAQEQQHPIEPLPEETVSQTAATVASSDPSSQSVPVVAPIVKDSTTMTTESGAVTTCCSKTLLFRQQDSLDLRRCECQAHRHPLPDGKQQDGSTEEEESSKDATAAGPQQCLLQLTDEGASITTSGDPSNDLRPPEADAAAGADGISPTVDDVSVKSAGNELELPTDDHSMAPSGLE